MSNLIETPGMRGKLTIHFDMSNGNVNVDFHGTDLRSAVQILLAAVQGTIAEWIKIDAGIIRPKGAQENGSEENGTGKKNDDDNGNGNSGE